MNAEPAEAYARRFRRVLEYIETHLDEDLRVELLSGVAAFSKFHFQRQFSASFGLSAAKYVQLLRFKRASYELAFRPERRVVAIALASGYDSHEAFSRAFKQLFGQTPSEFRECPEWEPFHSQYQRLFEIRSEQMKQRFTSEDVRIVDFPETRVAAFEHRGDPKTIGDSIRKFIEWRKHNDLPPRVSATFNIAYNSPRDSAPEAFRVDICAATQRDVTENAYGVLPKTIPGGRCAVIRHVGSDDLLGETLTYLYAQWLPASGEELRDFPLFFQRLKFFPDVPEHEATTDVFLPLR